MKHKIVRIDTFCGNCGQYGVDEDGECVPSSPTVLEEQTDRAYQAGFQDGYETGILENKSME